MAWKNLIYENAVGRQTHRVLIVTKNIGYFLRINGSYGFHNHGFHKCGLRYDDDLLRDDCK